MDNMKKPPSSSRSWRYSITKLCCLDHGWQFGAEDLVPESTRYTEAQLVVEEVMGEMVLLQSLVPERQILVVEEVVCQVVADVPEYATAVDGSTQVPVPVE